MNIKKNIGIKVLTIGPSLKARGGISQVIRTYSTFFQKFYFIATTGYNSRFSNLLHLLLAIIEFFYYMIFRKIDIVHIHSASKLSFRRKSIFVFFAKLFNKKVILHIHGGGFRNYYINNKKFVEHVLHKADLIIALSDSWKNLFKIECCCDNVCVLHNPIPNPILDKYPRKDDDSIFELLFLGTICKNKGVYDLLDIAENLQKKFHKRFLFHIGGIGEIDNLLKIIQKKKLENVVYEGWVEQDSKIKLLINADAFILPSYIEGLPLSILEAMSYMKPVIASNVGGIPEILQDTYNGYLTIPGDKESLEKIIIKMAELSPLERLAMGKRGFDISKIYWQNNVKHDLFAIYKNMLNN